MSSVKSPQLVSKLEDPSSSRFLHLSTDTLFSCFFVHLFFVKSCFSSPVQKRVQAPFISKGKSVNQGWHSELNPRHGQDKVVGPVYGSPVVISSNQEEISESDWEII